MILANALMKFDVKNVEGVEGRIPNLEFAAMVGFRPPFPWALCWFLGVC